MTLNAVTGLIGDNGCGFSVRECRRRSLRRRRSGGPELFASVVRRGNNFLSAQLPPLPQSATCSHAKLKVWNCFLRLSSIFFSSSLHLANFQSIRSISLCVAKQRTSSLSPPENIKVSTAGFGDGHRDWLLLGRRGSGALELLAGIWRQNRDRSERSSFDSDDSFFLSKSIEKSSIINLGINVMSMACYVMFRTSFSTTPVDGFICIVRWDCLFNSRGVLSFNRAH